MVLHAFGGKRPKAGDAVGGAEFPIGSMFHDTRAGVVRSPVRQLGPRPPVPPDPRTAASPKQEDPASANNARGRERWIGPVIALPARRYRTRRARGSTGRWSGILTIST